MGILREKINEDINKIKKEFENNKAILHYGIKGGFNENELVGLIKRIIPTRYIITRGIIENSESQQSAETDIIIYDNDILPFYMKYDLSFVPIEAVKYIFEVKSSLNATELKTTIDKFTKYKKMGGKSPSVLFAYSSDIQGNELERYSKYDKTFLTTPSISVLCVSDKCYYYKTVNEYYLKDIFSNEDWLSMLVKSGIPDFNKATEIFDELNNDELLNQLSRSQFALYLESRIQMNQHKKDIKKTEIILNGLEFSKIKFKIHKWIQVEKNSNNTENIEILSFLSGLSNTLSKDIFGNYLLTNEKDLFKICGFCYEDMWGNISCENFNVNGLECNPEFLSFTFQSNPDENSFKMIFNTKIH